MRQSSGAGSGDCGSSQVAPYTAVLKCARSASICCIPTRHACVSILTRHACVYSTFGAKRLECATGLLLTVVHRDPGAAGTGLELHKLHICRPASTLHVAEHQAFCSCPQSCWNMQPGTGCCTIWTMRAAHVQLTVICSLIQPSPPRLLLTSTIRSAVMTRTRTRLLSVWSNFAAESNLHLLGCSNSQLAGTCRPRESASLVLDSSGHLLVAHTQRDAAAH